MVRRVQRHRDDDSSPCRLCRHHHGLHRADAGAGAAAPGSGGRRMSRSVLDVDRSHGGWGDLFVRPPARRLLGASLVRAPVLAVSAAAAPQTATAPGESVIATLIRWTPLIARGFALNLAISFLAMAIGTVAGVALGLTRISLLAPVRGSAWITVQ